MRGSELATDDDSVVDHISETKRILYWNIFQQQSKNKLKKETPSTIVP